MKKDFLKWGIRLARPWFIFGSLTRPVIPYHVNLMFFDEKLGPDKQPNVGDLLSKVIFDYLLKHKGIKSLRSHQTYRVSFLGSVIQFLTGDAIVYGSGFLYESVVSKFALENVKLDIRAVRGPNTKRMLESIGHVVPEVFGDPAILLPMFYQPKIAAVKKDYIVIPHWKKIQDYDLNKYPVLSTLTSDWEYFIDEIVSSKLVVSASLHGVIIAESYGIPAILLGDTEKNDLFKYEDYYLSTGRTNFMIAKDVEEALKLETQEVPDIRKMQQQFLDAFPLDIFKNK
ncbi:polysaccharide pyruvyl transferase family protein [Flavobacterium piscis]|uniref:Pyruvyl transferase n=1 Tax=Flavobacterium piscis TaxID=1114874 RepID=A0ABU1Y949_9FLAO|nr:polysaccharide pyruvyl transferase family protein [Flavobacterium piscis]MDR7210673.1 pyruvyl transferase [Flavobacterium piscis]